MAGRRCTTARTRRTKAWTSSSQRCATVLAPPKQPRAARSRGADCAEAAGTARVAAARSIARRRKRCGVAGQRIDDLFVLFDAVQRQDSLCQRPLLPRHTLSCHQVVQCLSQGHARHRKAGLPVPAYARSHRHYNGLLNVRWIDWGRMRLSLPQKVPRGSEHVLGESIITIGRATFPLGLSSSSAKHFAQLFRLLSFQNAVLYRTPSRACFVDKTRMVIYHDAARVPKCIIQYFGMSIIMR